VSRRGRAQDRLWRPPAALPPIREAVTRVRGRVAVMATFPPFRANGLISALQTSSYCLVTREQSAARASITSTCHPILPGRAVRRPAVVRRRRALSRNAAWHASAAGRLHATADLACRQAAQAEER
jgi:hypothetical protein